MNDIIDPQNLRAMREAKSWDQQTLARNAGIDPSVISRLERGLQSDLKASVLVALAQALDIPTDALLVYSRQHTATAPIPELAVVMNELIQLSEGQQRQVAAIVKAYLLSAPK